MTRSSVKKVKAASAQTAGKMPKARVAILSLGCPKTVVDSEIILGKLNRHKYRIVPSVTDCDIAILNTCAFIDDAKRESVDRILELIELKKEGLIGRIVVVGCLVQRFAEELQAELSEVDAFMGSGDYAKAGELLDEVLQGHRAVRLETPGYLTTSDEKRVSLTPKHFRYLKISEGCNHLCSFCSIPSFRGKHRSRPVEDIVREARQLLREGAREIILTGQDTAYYGKDFSGHFLLPELLGELDRLPGIGWIRVLYAYPSFVTEDLMRTIGSSERICSYLDMALQHINDRVLHDMRRSITKQQTLNLIRRFRELVPDLAIRTSFIVGFPGETDREFEEMLEFMEEVRFERLGVFTYSREEGTPAASLPGQISDELKARRLEKAMLLQQRISRQLNARWIGREMTVLLDGKCDDRSGMWMGRSYMDAPEVDGNVFVRTTGKVKAGMFCRVRIESAKEYDLVGQMV